MSEHGPWRELARAVRQARDGQLLRLVALLDGLRARGAAEALLEGLRPRLAALRPERPLSLTRILCIPIEAALRAPGAWKGEAGTVPRSAIAPLAVQLERTQPRLVQEVAAAAQGHVLPRALGLCGRLGERLWPAAAESLQPAPPPGWEATGLPDAAYAAIAPTCRVLWTHAADLWALRMLGDEGPPEAAIRQVFRVLAGAGPEAVRLGIEALLPHVARPGRLVVTVSAIDNALTRAADAALDGYLEALARRAPRPDAPLPPEALRREAALIEEIERIALQGRPQRARTLAALRDARARDCRDRLERDIAACLLAPLEALRAAPAGIEQRLAALEAEAERLRMLAEAERRFAGRKAGTARHAPALARLAAMARAAPNEGPGVQRADLLRLIEIMAGPEAALGV